MFRLPPPIGLSTFRKFRGLILCACCMSAPGCSTFKMGGEEKEAKAQAIPVPGKNSLRQSQYVFYADFPLKEHEAVFRELGELRDQVFGELALPSAGGIIQVFLFEDQSRYERYMKSRYPDLPRRRAFFIAQPRMAGGAEDLLVFTYWGDNITQDLRHELTHALLHSVLRDVPLWLDEGLAEYFELPPGQEGFNPSHLHQLKTGPFAPDMARLEGLTQVMQMERAEYREAWAWVHFFLKSKPETKKVLLDYLKELQGPPVRNGPSLLARLRELYPAVNDALWQHLNQIEVPHADDEK